jgi:2-polyprenyl-3-methyl-5-hydroxy-6-metoxy-1,4-benzoquinol methylase
MSETQELQPEHDWPADDLEAVRACPLCASPQRTLAYRGVRDWTFDSAAGSWTFWDCAGCRSLYLDPRPTAASIGQAYQAYYTHGNGRLGGLRRFKQRVINECWSHWLDTDVQPRLGVPAIAAGPLAALHECFPPPFELEVLSTRPRGRLMDVGCGNGGTLALAAAMGFDTEGIEFDPSAVRTAQARGLRVIEGDYTRLGEFHDAFDYLICSHTVEHVHRPLELLRLVRQAMKDGGTAFISCPNARSHVRHRFGASWRGLEAPRHLAIPSLSQLTEALQGLGFAVTQVNPAGSTTIKQSKRIARRRGVDAASELSRPAGSPAVTRSANPDLIQLVCTKPGL